VRVTLTYHCTNEAVPIYYQWTFVEASSLFFRLYPSVLYRYGRYCHAMVVCVASRRNYSRKGRRDSGSKSLGSILATNGGCWESSPWVVAPHGVGLLQHHL
jgi:hypothetical protein